MDLRDPDLPNHALHNSDGGARLTTFWHGFDLSANALWHWEDIPIAFRRIDLGGAVPTVVVEPGYRRTAVLGGSASNAFGNLTVRAEAAYTTRRFLPIDDPSDRDGVAQTGEFGAVLGFDWYGIPETLQSESSSGSRAWFFQYPDGVVIKNSASRIAPGVDVRGS